MRRPFLQMLVCTLLIAGSAGCGGGSSGGGPGNSVTFTFDTAPTAAAVQIGTGNFELASLHGTSLGVSLPIGTSNYSIAYVCPPFVQGVPPKAQTFTEEFVIQASMQDGTSFNVTCLPFSPNPTLASLKGSLDTTAIPGAAFAGIASPGFEVGVTNSAGTQVVNGPFSVNLPTGTSDLAVQVFDSTTPFPNFLAAKILRNQTVPGMLNGGSTVVFQPADEITSQPLTISNVPAGFSSPPRVLVNFVTASGLDFNLSDSLEHSQFLTQYLVMPSAAVQSGDFYNFQITTQSFNSNGTNQIVATSQNITGGGPVTISLPAPFLYNGPTPATFPTFIFNYSGFPTVLAQQAEIGWSLNSSTSNDITVTATANFQNGANTVAIPNLASLSGFLAPAASGMIVDWQANIWGGTTQSVTNFLQPIGLSFSPHNGSILSQVGIGGAYAAP